MYVEITTGEDKGTMDQNRYAVRVDGDITMPRATREQIKDFLDGLDLRARIMFDCEQILDFDDVDLWFGPRA